MRVLGGKSDIISQAIQKSLKTVKTPKVQDDGQRKAVKVNKEAKSEFPQSQFQPPYFPYCNMPYPFFPPPSMAYPPPSMAFPPPSMGFPPTQTTSSGTTQPGTSSQTASKRSLACFYCKGEDHLMYRDGQISCPKLKTSMK